jgi:hypothetical protein
LLKRFFLLIAALTGVAAPNAALRAADVEVQLYPLSGEVRLLNPNETAFPFVYYELKSAAGAFSNNAAWTSIADTYDASGNGFISATDDWVELSNLPTMVAEGLFIGSSSALPASRSISLGPIWNPDAVKPNDVTAKFLTPSLAEGTVSVVISLLGDYNQDLVVDSADFAVWHGAFGSTSSPRADGNFDGVVDSADYTIWRDNFGADISGEGFDPPIGVGSGSIGSGGGFALAIPEPATALLAGLAGCGFLTLRRRR